MKFNEQKPLRSLTQNQVDSYCYIELFFSRSDDLHENARINTLIDKNIKRALAKVKNFYIVIAGKEQFRIADDLIRFIQRNGGYLHIRKGDNVVIEWNEWEGLLEMGIKESSKSFVTISNVHSADTYYIGHAQYYMPIYKKTDKKAVEKIDTVKCIFSNIKVLRIKL